jgi:serine/threonine protein phosphatase 1
VEQAFLVFVGDLIDRGPESRGVLERLRTYRHPRLKSVFLMGNHEEYALRVLAGDRDVLKFWLEYGGKEFVASYGLDGDALLTMEEGEALAKVRRAVPDEHRRFLKSFADTFRFGDYLFVHAGVRPGLALDEQSRADLRWIREPFLEDSGDHGFVVVHGHTIVDEVQERPNRIGIDTGAYRTGVLTALVIEGAERRFLSTADMLSGAGSVGSTLSAASVRGASLVQ